MPQVNHHGPVKSPEWMKWVGTQASDAWHAAGAFDDRNGNVLTRIGGGLESAAGFVEGTAGAAMTTTGIVLSGTGAGAVLGVPLAAAGAVVAVDGAEHIVNGGETALFATHRETLAQQAAGGIAEAAGASPTTVAVVKGVTGIGVPTAGVVIRGAQLAADLAKAGKAAETIAAGANTAAKTADNVASATARTTEAAAPAGSGTTGGSTILSGPDFERIAAAARERLLASGQDTMRQPYQQAAANAGGPAGTRSATQILQDQQRAERAARQASTRNPSEPEMQPQMQQQQQANAGGGPPPPDSVQKAIDAAARARASGETDSRVISTIAQIGAAPEATAAIGGNNMLSTAISGAQTVYKSGLNPMIKWPALGALGLGVGIGGYYLLNLEIASSQKERATATAALDSPFHGSAQPHSVEPFYTTLRRETFEKTGGPNDTPCDSTKTPLSEQHGPRVQQALKPGEVGACATKFIP